MTWHKVEMGKVVKVASGFGFPKEYQGTTGGEFPFFKVGDMNLVGNERCMTNIVNSISDATLKKLKAKAFPEGTIIFPKIGAAIATNKKRMLVQPSVVDNNVMGLIPKPLVNPWYLYYWMLQFDLKSVTNIGPVPSMRKTEVERVLIPLPPHSEQCRIVEILDQADALRKKRTEADKKAARILPALFYKMFGDPATNPRGWDTVFLEDVLADTRNGLYKHGDFYGRGTQILKMFNIQSGELELSRVDRVELTKNEAKKYALNPGDILINRVNTKELVGKCAVITTDLGPAVFESKNIRARLNPDKATPEFVAYYLNTTFGHAALCQGVKHAIGMATINNTDLRRMVIPRPPLGLQKTWDARVHEIRKNKESRKKVCARLNQLFDVLLHRAFTGNLTAKWREEHMKELLQEMEQQAKTLEIKEP